ncbi:MAG: hypothetical protein IJ494_03915 [Bacteroides sp.]|nr:hypothetical protein [Bacteroides sp.]
MRIVNHPCIRCLMLTVLTTLLYLPLSAQQFNVRSFRLLPNDITAYIDPVRDLNQEACALIKVVCESDFAFSTPLGIVQRRNDVGEVWLYVPRGTLMLTLKHPRWGVLRDYRFESPLESRMTYEMVVGVPITTTEPSLPHLSSKPLSIDTTVHTTTALEVPPPSRIKRPRERMHYLVLANVGVHSKGPDFGLRAIAMRRHGAYLLLQSDFGSIPTTQGECNAQGELSNSGETPYYTGRTQDGRRLLVAGGVHRLVGGFCLYEGVGYGQHQVSWETVEGEQVLNTEHSVKGITAELGGLYHFRRLTLSAGVLTIAAKHWEAIIGIGIHF